LRLPLFAVGSKLKCPLFVANEMSAFSRSRRNYGKVLWEGDVKRQSLAARKARSCREALNRPRTLREMDAPAPADSRRLVCGPEPIDRPRSPCGEDGRR
jgi:hypothetical protein